MRGAPTFRSQEISLYHNVTESFAEFYPIHTFLYTLDAKQQPNGYGSGVNQQHPGGSGEKTNKPRAVPEDRKFASGKGYGRKKHR